MNAQWLSLRHPKERGHGRRDSRRIGRRIVTYCKPGDKSSIDRHMGFIKFGSRVDIYLPVDSLICVKMNQKVTGNITILAKLA